MQYSKPFSFSCRLASGPFTVEFLAEFDPQTNELTTQIQNANKAPTEDDVRMINRFLLQFPLPRNKAEREKYCEFRRKYELCISSILKELKAKLRQEKESGKVPLPSLTLSEVREYLGEASGLSTAQDAGTEQPKPTN